MSVRRRSIAVVVGVVLVLLGAAVTSPAWAAEAGWRFARTEITMHVQCNGVVGAEGWYSEPDWELARALRFGPSTPNPLSVEGRRGLSGTAAPHAELRLPDGTWRRVRFTRRDRRLLLDRSPTRFYNVGCSYTG